MNDVILAKNTHDWWYTIDISGMNGVYELKIQYVLWEAYTWLHGRKMTYEEILDWMIKQDWINKAGLSSLQATVIAAHLAVLLDEGYDAWISRFPPCRKYHIDWKLLDCFRKCYLEG